MLHAPTPSEEALWQALRTGALGVAFKRQVPLRHRFIADFLAPSVGLVVEVDGSAHRARRSADRRRDEKLRRWGYRVVRVEAVVVLRNPEAALAVVRSALQPPLQTPLAPPPNVLGATASPTHSRPNGWNWHPKTTTQDKGHRKQWTR
jgi:very-short-patch-repair endonuclease